MFGLEAPCRTLLILLMGKDLAKWWTVHSLSLIKKNPITTHKRSLWDCKYHPSVFRSWYNWQCVPKPSAQQKTHYNFKMTWQLLYWIAGQQLDWKASALGNAPPNYHTPIRRLMSSERVSRAWRREFSSKFCGAAIQINLKCRTALQNTQNPGSCRREQSKQGLILEGMWCHTLETRLPKWHLEGQKP